MLDKKEMAGNILPAYGGPRAFAQTNSIINMSDKHKMKANHFAYLLYHFYLIIQIKSRNPAYSFVHKSRIIPVYLR